MDNLQERVINTIVGAWGPLEQEVRPELRLIYIAAKLHLILGDDR